MMAIGHSMKKKRRMKRKTIHITFRMTEEDAGKLNSLMKLMGYRNRSTFLREQLLRGRVQRRNLRKTEANLSRQIEQLQTEIKRIGVNYNQAVRALNTLSKLRDKYGNAVVSAAVIDGKLTDMKSLMEAALKKLSQIASEVEASGEPEHV